MCCIKGFISTVCSLSWKNIENCQNIEEQKVFSKAYFGTNWIINAKRRNQSCKNLSSPFLRPHDWVSVGKFEKCAPAALTMDWKVTILLRIAVHVFIRDWMNRFSSAACLCLQSIFAAEPIYWADQLVGKQDWQTGISWGRMDQKEMRDNLGLGIFHNQQMDSFVQLEGDKRRLETLSKCPRATRMKDMQTPKYKSVTNEQIAWGC